LDPFHWPHQWNDKKCKFHIWNYEEGRAQNVLELPSTAMLAPCAPISAVLLAEIADFEATLVPAVKPRMLKHVCPAPLKRNWPLGKKTERKWIHMFVVILHRFPALPIDSNRSRRNLSKTLRSLRPLRCIFSQWRSQSGRLANIAKVLGHRLRQLTVHMIQQQGLRHQHLNCLS